MTTIVKAKVVGNQAVRPEVFLLTLETPEIAAAARPGQFVMLKVAPGPDPLLARPFSVHGTDGGKLLILYQVRGKGTRLLAEAEPGLELTLWGPQGRGFDLGGAKRPILVAGGMGMAPLAFAAKVLEERAIPSLFLNGGANQESIRGLEDRLEAMLVAGIERGSVERLRSFFAAKTKAAETSFSGAPRIILGTSTEDGSFGHKGLVTDLLEESLSASQDLQPDLVLSCGPLPMLKAVARICAKQKVASQVSLEAPMACGVGACQGCVQPAAGGGYLRVCQEGPVLDAAQVDWERV